MNLRTMLCFPDFYVLNGKMKNIQSTSVWAFLWAYKIDMNSRSFDQWFQFSFQTFLSCKIIISVENSNFASFGLLSTMLKPKLWIWGRCRVSQIFMSAHASFKNRSLFGLVSAYHSFFFLFFPPHHNRKKNRRQCKDMDNCLVQFFLLKTF